jgi:hypothetical protein
MSVSAIRRLASTDIANATTENHTQANGKKVYPTEVGATEGGASVIVEPSMLVLVTLCDRNFQSRWLRSKHSIANSGSQSFPFSRNVVM